MKRIQLLIMVGIIAWGSQCWGAWNPNDVVVTNSGYLEVAFIDPNYDANGGLLPGRGRVDVYRLILTPEAGGQTMVVNYPRGTGVNSNMAILTTSGSQKLPVEGDYTLSVILVQVNNGQQSFIPNPDFIKVKYVIPEPPIILPSPVRFEDILGVKDPETETDFR